jgi:hypothetical protein
MWRPDEPLKLLGEAMHVSCVPPMTPQRRTSVAVTGREGNGDGVIVDIQPDEEDKRSCVCFPFWFEFNDQPVWLGTPAIAGAPPTFPESRHTWLPHHQP